MSCQWHLIPRPSRQHLGRKKENTKKKICELPLAHPRISVTSICIKRDLRMWQKRPTYVAKETYVCGKRDLRMWQKRPTYVAKEAYVCGKRDLRMWQKRPTYVAKEAYLPDLGCYSTSLRL